MTQTGAALRQWLLKRGYGVSTSRHTEISRAKRSVGLLTAYYTVRLRWPDGQTTSHTEPDALLLAYRAACASTPQWATEAPGHAATLFCLDQGRPDPLRDVPLVPRHNKNGRKETRMMPLLID